MKDMNYVVISPTLRFRIMDLFTRFKGAIGDLSQLGRERRRERHKMSYTNKERENGKFKFQQPSSSTFPS